MTILFLPGRAQGLRFLVHSAMVWMSMSSQVGLALPAPARKERPQTTVPTHSVRDPLPEWEEGAAVQEGSAGKMGPIPQKQWPGVPPHHL